MGPRNEIIHFSYNKPNGWGRLIITREMNDIGGFFFGDFAVTCKRSGLKKTSVNVP